MSSVKSEEPLASWAFEAAIAGLPEEEALSLLESDRVPEPEEAEWADGTETLELEGSGDVVVFRSNNDEAWVQSDVSRDLDSMR